MILSNEGDNEGDFELGLLAIVSLTTLKFELIKQPLNKRGVDKIINDNMFDTNSYRILFAKYKAISLHEQVSF